MFRSYLNFNTRRITRRGFHLNVSHEVQEALRAKLPVVSLESTIITHGLPYPQNLEMAFSVEKTIRDHGAVPATTAFINGIPRVGLTPSEIEQLAEFSRDGSANKVSRRDIAYTIANKLHGGTTISSSMILSRKAGIQVFATGGLGGVHRGGELSLDISADLEELGRTPVAVVCAGPKAILDIPRTLEYLETKGCLVATMGPPGANVPGFYTRDSGVKSPYTFDSYLAAARIINSGNGFGLNSGYLFCCPPPAEVALDSDFINRVIEEACQTAERNGIRGKELTPYLLKEIAFKSQGASVKSNVAFVLNNAMVAANIASSLARLRTDGDTPKNPDQIPLKTEVSNPFTEMQSAIKTYSVVVGAVALDTQCTFKSNEVLNRDSNPGKLSASIGGVGHNVALSANLSNRSETHQTVLISSVGKDFAGKYIISALDMPIEGIFINENQDTAQYISVHSNNGELLIAGSDMDIVTEIPLEHIIDKIRSLKPNVVLVDANVSVKTLNTLVTLRGEQGFKLLLEPTSGPKSRKLSQLSNLGVFPNNNFDLITPTVSELKEIYKSLDANGKFDLDHWFPVLDCLQIDRNLSSSKNPPNSVMRYLLKEGILQTASFLLPYFPRMIVKDGSNGVFVFSVEANVQPNVIHAMADMSDFSLFLQGNSMNGIQYGVLIEHHRPPFRDVGVVNVTGAGDTLVGILLNELSVNPNCLELTDPIQRKRCLDRAQHGAKLSLEDKNTISKRLRTLS